MRGDPDDIATDDVSPLVRISIIYHVLCASMEGVVLKITCLRVDKLLISGRRHC